MKKLYFILFIGLMLASCASEEKCEECEIEANDTIPKKDTIASLEDALQADKTLTVTKEQVENHEKIVKKYGEQWDFCACIHANDSIDKAFKKKLTTKQEEKLMARWEYVDVKCKEFLTNPNTTPEERAIHEKKVKKCLRNK
ncbi:MAG: hypothetical protein ACK5B9_16130 [Flavobacteriia bacterium]|jgi:hypothetical protein